MSERVKPMQDNQKKIITKPGINGVGMARNVNDDEIKVDIEQCRKALSNFCKGTYRMCVPAQPDDDDMVLCRALDELEAARAALTAAKKQIIECICTFEHVLDSEYCPHEDINEAIISANRFLDSLPHDEEITVEHLKTCERCMERETNAD